MRRVPIVVLASVLSLAAVPLAAGPQQPASRNSTPSGQQTPGAASAPSTAPTASAAAEPQAIRVDVLIQRKKGTQVVSSLPYTMFGETGDGRGLNGLSLRLGSDVPIQTAPAPSAENRAPAPTIPSAPSIQYRSVGTSLDCFVRLRTDGRYEIRFTLDDSSVGNASSAGAGPTDVIATPVIHSYRFTTNLVLKDGERQEINVATDKVSGETVVAEVTVKSL